MSSERGNLHLDRGFLLLEADAGAPPGEALTCGRAAALLASGGPRWLIVRRVEGTNVTFYAMRRPETGQLGKECPERPLLSALGKFSESPTMTLAQFAHASVRNAVVLHAGIPVGITVGASSRGNGDRDSRGAERDHGGTGQARGTAQPLAHRLEAALPSAVRLGDVVSLLVTLRRIDAASGSGDFTLREGEEVDLVVHASGGLRLPGTNTMTMKAAAGPGFELVQFKLLAESPGDALVKVYAFRAGRSLALLEIAVHIDAGGDTASSHDETSTVLPFAVPTVKLPDLCLLVTESGDLTHFRLQSKAQGVRDFPPVALHDMQTHSRELIAAIEGLSLGDGDRTSGAQRKLELWGANLFTFLPQELQRILWDRRGEEMTVQVTSDEAWIPWEACRLCGRDDTGHQEEGAHFAEAFAMTRWLHGMPAPERLRFSNWALVIPRTGDLPSADDERRFLLELARAGRQVTEVAARFLALTQAFRLGTYDAWHFCGHAHAGTSTNGDRAALKLDERESMTADLFAGSVENALLPRPFIFFNACQSALGGLSATGVGGWAHRFIRPNLERRGAAAFVGTYWSVYDASAHEFAKTLYSELFRGQPIGLATRTARRNARQHATSADPLSWLAYTVYADPLALVENP